MTSTPLKAKVAPRSRGRALAAAGISRSFQGVRALHDVTVRVDSTQIMGLIGPNGAGKSTLVNILSGYDRPDTGAVELDGVDITKKSGFRRSRLGIARTFQHGHIFRALSVRENVEVTALASGRTARQSRQDSLHWLELMDLLDWSDRGASNLPHGVERRLGVARALATWPGHVLLDEPAAGLNEGEVEAFALSIRKVNKEYGIGVLLIDHNMPLIMGLCDRVHVLVHGESLLEGPPDEVRKDKTLAVAYLGSTATREGVG